MIKKYISAGIVLFAICAAFCAGCGKKNTASDVQVFNSAAPEIKAVWDNAQAADKVNDYVVASRGYQSLLAQADKLAPDQLEVLQAAAIAINQRLNEAFNNGDPEAKKAMAALAPGAGPGR